ncbi:MAG TPA: FMN-binding protein [Burkholderiales bacterium]|jgi:Na+-translocating ferredoxin:NAD+ oxidoreductase RnfG subunit|nr:FMN-binding protein [Burkholderiales bacterium]
MRTRWPAFIAAPLVVMPAAHATTYLTVEQAQQVLFPGASFTPVDVKRKERVWRASAGWFVVDEVLGKHELITYAVGLDAQGRVRGIEILDYRESHGGEIRDPQWRLQFAGKTGRDPLQLDRDIRNISGATLSCRHVTDGVKRILAMYESDLRSR